MPSFPDGRPTMDIAARLTLNDGVAIPCFGLGLYQMGGGKRTEDAVRWALEAGYRHFDTAALYRNEAELGAALRRAIADGLVARDDVFVTTKLWNDDHGHDRALRAFDASMERLGLDVVDLYLIHWPVERRRLDSWRALEAIRKGGRARSIGVSNYTVRHLSELLDAGGSPPSVNQIELHPFHQRRDIVAFCRKHQIAVEAYSPLTKGHKLDDRRLVALAKAAGKSPAQLLIRWSLQKGFVCIPKSADKTRLAQNAAVFEFALTDAQMAALDALDAREAITWDPTDAP